MRIAFVSNFCPHYRIRTFEALSRRVDVDFYFYSVGDEWYWQQKHGVSSGAFRAEYLRGFRIGSNRIPLTLPGKLWRGDYDAIIKCINGKAALPMTYAMARLRRTPFVLWTGIWTRLQTPSQRLAWPATRFIYTHADAVVTYGEHVKRYLRSEGVDDRRIFVAAHAVDNDVYGAHVPAEVTARLRAELKIDQDQPVVLYLGRFEAVKGLTYLLEAFAKARLERAVLLLAGDGSQRADLARLAEVLGVASSVRLAGYVPTSQAASLYALASVFVLPSVATPSGKETWGLVVNEAMNQGVPVIATDAVGAAAGGLVEDEVTGLVVPERNAEALASALGRLLGDETLRARLGANARERIAGWDNERMVGGFLAAIDYAIFHARHRRRSDVRL
jgi:glycosyltransferase involved in cell wall biosynthesis